MRVLWFSVTPSLFTLFNNGHNGGGWIASLEQLIRDNPDVTLGIAFEYPCQKFKEQHEGVTYYPLDTRISFTKKVKKFFSPLKFEEDYFIPKCLKVIADFKPDIIQIFGSENYYGLLGRFTSVPIIIHMQGSLPSYYNARFPVALNFNNILCSRHYSLIEKIIEYRNSLIFQKRAIREISVLKQTSYFFGRTHWDKSITRIYNPTAHYFYCSEALRDIFYTKGQWHYPEPGEIVLISTISSPLYKGIDVILKTARILKDICHFAFVWKILGISKCSFIESHYKIKASDVNVELLGCVSENEVVEQLMNAHFYIHPSYIDNSPNSVCEAQMVGTPVICCNVGGVSSLIDDGKTGFLVSANDPVKIADIVIQQSQRPSILSTISRQEITAAAKRHSKKQIVNDLLSAYSAIYKQGNRERNNSINTK